MGRGIGSAAWALLAMLAWGCDDTDADGADMARGPAADARADEGLDAAPDEGPPDAQAMPPDGSAPDAGPDAAVEPDLGPDLPPERGPDPDPSRRMNHVQVRGTHNSYHVANQPTIPEWRYTHLPLSEQLGDQGVRQFELDVHWRPETEDFAVYHLPGVDDLSVCPLFADCLREIGAWLRANPEEGPIYVLVEPKDDADPHLVRDHFDALDAEIRGSLAAWRLITPDDVRGAHPDLRTAVLTDGWPSLHDARGRVMLVLLDDSESRDAYVEPDPTLAGRVMFAAGGPDAPWSGVMLRDGAVEQAEGTLGFVARGFIVRTRAEERETFQVAVDSGAHMISTDFPDVLRFPGGAAERCNPVAAGCED